MGKKKGKRLRTIARLGMLALLLGVLPSCGSKKTENEESVTTDPSTDPSTAPSDNSDAVPTPPTNPTGDSAATT